MDQLWKYLTEQFSTSLSPMSYKTWIKDTHPQKLTQTEFVLAVPTALHLKYWQEKLLTSVVEGAYEFLGREINPVIISETEDNEHLLKEETPPVEDKKEVASTFSTAPQLNNKYTFETFIIGKGNQMAHAAALVVAEEPGKMYNPLFFYGGVGLGKTHLMHAIGNKLLESNPNAKIKYVTSEAFTNDYINSIRKNKQEELRQEYRNVDLLLVDDIQFFGDKEGTQEEFFHTFNELYNDKKQIVLTSDRLPNEIPKLEERLVSRFKWGLSVDITPPDFETRIAILRDKAEIDDFEIPDDTLTYIAGQIDSNVRELEGALMRVQAYATMKNQDITTSLAADALKSLQTSVKSNTVSIEIIQDIVAKYYHVSMADLKGKKRIKTIVIPRQVSMYLARELTDAPFTKIGQEFGGKDHTTVLHSYEKISDLLETDSTLKNEIAEIKEKFHH